MANTPSTTSDRSTTVMASMLAAGSRCLSQVRGSEKKVGTPRSLFLTAGMSSTSDLPSGGPNATEVMSPHFAVPRVNTVEAAEQVLAVAAVGPQAEASAITVTLKVELGGSTSLVMNSSPGTGG